MRMKSTSEEASRPRVRIAGKSYRLAAPAGSSGDPRRALPKGSDCTKITAARVAAR
jgi:hypothetical protein